MTKRPNIVFIFNDHQAYSGHGEMSGGPKVQRPFIEKLASEGIEFTRAYSVCPLCGPVRRTILTGLFPHNHGEIKNDTKHPYDKEVYLDTLAEAGYNNYYYGKWHAGKGDAKDFHCEGYSHTGYGNPYITPEYDDYLKRKGLPKFQVLIKHNFFDPDSTYNKLLNVHVGELHTPLFFHSSEHSTGVMTTPKETHEAFFLADLACEKLKELAQDKSKHPFHLRVDFWGPHQPYYTTQEYLDLYDPKTIPEYPSFSEDLKDKPEHYMADNNYLISKDGKLIIPNPLPWSTWQEILTYNYAQQTLIDAAGGKIIDTLDRLGFADNTIVIWATDHGDSVACHGGHFDKDVYMIEEMVHIPMVIRYPNVIEAGQKTDKLVSNLDISPTILDVAGTSFQDYIDGKSLLPLCKNPDIYWREDLMSQTHGHFTQLLGRMIVTERYKYVWNEGYLDELYDLKTDPFELNNQIKNNEFNEVLKDMKRRLEIWRKKTGDNITEDMIKGRRLKRKKAQAK